MDPSDHAEAYQHRALDFMLGALDLDDARETAHRAAAVFAFAQRSHELIRDYARMLRRVDALERALEQCAREAEERDARDSERHPDDI